MATLTIDPNLSPRLIVVDAPDTEITLQELVNLLRDWEDELPNHQYPPLIAAAGKENLGGGVQVGITATLQNAQVQFEGRTSRLTNGSVTTTDSTGTRLIDSTATFTTYGITRGDTVFNSSFGCMATILEIVSDTELLTQPLTGGPFFNYYLSGNTYNIYENVQCNISGGNLVAVDDVGADLTPVLQSANVQVVRTSSSSATLQNQENIEAASFNGEVAIDVNNGTAGTTFPTGTHQQPALTVVDGVTIAAARGLEILSFHGATTLTSGDNVSGYTITGQNPISVQMTIEAGANVLDCQFLGITVTNSVLDGNNWLQGCTVENLVYVEGSVKDCLMRGTIQLGGTANTYFMDCKSGCVGLGASDLPVLDMNDGEHNTAFRNWAGPLKIINMTDADSTMCVDVVSGATLIIDASCTAGTIYIRGTCNIQNNGTTTIVDTAQLDPVNVRDVYKANFHKRTNSSNVITIYEDDKVTPFKQFNTNADLSEIDPQ